MGGGVSLNNIAAGTPMKDGLGTSTFGGVAKCRRWRTASTVRVPVAFLARSETVFSLTIAFQVETCTDGTGGGARDQRVANTLERVHGEGGSSGAFVVR